MKNTKVPTDADFQNLVNLLSVFSEATHRLAEMQANINAAHLETIDDYKEAYAEMQKTLTEAETAIELTALKHPEWFTERKSLKTPYGTVKFHRSTSLVVKNEELSIEVIERDAAKHGLDPAQLIRQTKALDMEALEKLDDTVLKAFRIGKEPKENFSVVAAKIDLGKAVKEAAERPAATEAA